MDIPSAVVNDSIKLSITPRRVNYIYLIICTYHFFEKKARTPSKKSQQTLRSIFDFSVNIFYFSYSVYENFEDGEDIDTDVASVFIYHITFYFHRDSTALISANLGVNFNEIGICVDYFLGRVDYIL